MLNEPKNKAQRYLWERYEAEYVRALEDFEARGLSLSDPDDRQEMAGELRDNFWQLKRWPRA